MRKMASIRTIDAIKPIAGADRIELAVIGGWQVIVKKEDGYQPGQMCVYAEIDSWIPTQVAPFLTKGAKEPRVYDGVAGERLRTVKMRGEVSQGLVLPLSVIPREAMDKINEESRYTDQPGIEVFSSIDGWDVTDVLGIKKWEKSLPTNMQGNARHYFPNFIQKTDQERIQNRLRTLENRRLRTLENRDPDEVFEVTLKMDGSSTTFYHYNGETGVCSRNLELKTDESNDGNLFVQMYRQLEIEDRLKRLGYNIALQGELWGEGINGNWEGVQGHRFHLFDVFDCDRYRYVDANTRLDILEKLNRDLYLPEIMHVPFIGRGTLADFGLGSLNIEDFLKFADRPSMYNPIAEGVVFKSLSDPSFSFKCINNKYLLEGGDGE